MTGNLKDLKQGCLGWIVIYLLAFLLALCQAKCSEKDKEDKKADKKAQIEAPTTSYYCTDEELLEMRIEELEEDLAYERQRANQAEEELQALRDEYGLY